MNLSQTAARYWDVDSAAVIGAFPDDGIISVDSDPSLEQALEEAAIPVTAKWIKDATAAGIDAQAALDFYRNRVKELMQ